MIVTLGLFKLVGHLSQRSARGGGRGSGGVDGVRELSQLALAGKNAVKLAVRREKANSLSADQVSLRRDKRFADLELGTRPDRLCGIGSAAYAAQPIAKEACDLWPRRS